MSAPAAKEPSMEDILASIRKIISEDSGDGTGNDEISTDASSTVIKQTAPEPAAMQPNQIAAQHAPELVERRESFEETLKAATVEGAGLPANDQTDNENPLLRADAGTFNNSEPLPTDDTSLHPAIENAKAYMKTHDVVPGNVGAALNEKPVFSSSAAPREQLDTQSAKMEPLISPDSIERRDESERRNHPLRRGADRDSGEFKNALMSPQADNAVVNAFEQLKNSATDNLDGKVEALLRPMLREWLDNNLPSMVERLVRDEIERVSRGE